MASLGIPIEHSDERNSWSQRFFAAKSLSSSFRRLGHGKQSDMPQSSGLKRATYSFQSLKDLTNPSDDSPTSSPEVETFAHPIVLGASNVRYNSSMRNCASFNDVTSVLMAHAASTASTLVAGSPEVERSTDTDDTVLSPVRSHGHCDEIAIEDKTAWHDVPQTGGSAENSPDIAPQRASRRQLQIAIEDKTAWHDVPQTGGSAENSPDIAPQRASRRPLQDSPIAAIAQIQKRRLQRIATPINRGAGLSRAGSNTSREDAGPEVAEVVQSKMLAVFASVEDWGRGAPHGSARYGAGFQKLSKTF